MSHMVLRGDTPAAQSHARKRRRVLWTMTVLGFAAPAVTFGKFFRDNGVNRFSVAKVAKESVATLPAAAILADASLTAATFLTWAKWDAHTHRVRGWWVVFPATYLVGICFGAPLYLLLREYAIADR